MTDLDFSYSISVPNVPSDTQASLWSFNSVKLLPFDANTTALHNNRTNQGLLVRAEVAHALSLCKAFRSLDAHLENILAAMPPLRENPEDVLNILTSIRDAGFLESNTDAWQRLTQDAVPHGSSPSRVFILTCDRPAALERVLKNLSEITLDHTIESVWVIDDSKQGISSQQNAAAIAGFENRLSIPLHHVNPTMQTRLYDHLSDALPEHGSSLSFLLDGDHWPNTATYGRARNLALLLSVGYRALVMDDDILPKAIAPPFARRGLKLGTALEREAQFYENRDTLMQHALDMGDNPVSLMLGNLGQTLGSLMSEQLSGAADLAGWDGNVLGRHKACSPVLLNQCGTWGDPGTGDGGWAFFLPEPSLKSFLAASVPMDLLLGARSNWVGYRGPTLSPYGSISQLTGLDHRALLPPYFPAGRGEDILFGIMLQRLHPESMVLSEGWSIRHDPLESRPERGNLLPVKVSPGLHTLADWLGREPDDQWGLTPERRINLLSKEVRTLSEMSSEALEQLVGEQLASKRTHLLARCVNHLEHVTALEPSANADAWSAFLSQTQAELIEALQAPESEPIDSVLAKSDRSDWSSLRTMGTQLANALAAWPEICAAAKRFTPNHPR